MKQILQNLKTGATEIVDVPASAVGRGRLLIRTSRTLVSAGTERMLVDFGKAGWIEKARQQPEKVMQVIDKIRTDGLMPTVEAVFNKLDEPMPLGYCNAGVVIDDGMVRQAHHDTLGQAQTDIKIGDRVASNGPHAEIVCVPRNLRESAISVYDEKHSVHEERWITIGKAVGDRLLVVLSTVSRNNRLMNVLSVSYLPVMRQGASRFSMRVECHEKRI